MATPGNRPTCPPPTAAPCMPEQKSTPTPPWAQPALGSRACGASTPSIVVTKTKEFPANHSFADVFEELLLRVDGGSCMARLGWNGQDLRVFVQWPDSNSKMTAPYLYLQKPDGTRTPWVPSMGDLFATDWAILD